MLIVVISIISTLSISAQDDTPKFQANVYLKANASQIDGDELSGFRKPGVAAGIGTNYLINESWFLSIKLGYTLIGSKGVIDEVYNYEIPLHYLEMPIEIGYQYKNMRITTGLAPSYLLQTGTIILYGQEDSNNIFAQGYKSQDWKATVGFEYLFSNDISGSINFNKSIINIRTKDAGQTNRYLSFGLAYHF